MKSERRDRKPYAAWCDRCHIRIANGEYNPKHRIGKKQFHEDETFWANLDATRRAMERATAGIDMSTLAFAAEDAAKLASTMDFEKISSTLAPGDYALRQYERFSTNSALVGETLASAIARSSIALPELNSPARSTLRLAAAEIPKFEIPSSLLAGAHAIELARMNDAVTGAMRSIAFDNLAASDRSYNQHGYPYIPAESVYAVLEPKQELDKELVEYAGKKAESVRKLKWTSGKITAITGNHGPREPFVPLAGIVAYESTWKPSPFGDAFVKSLDGLTEPQRLDFGIAAAHGCFEVNHDKKLDRKSVV